MTKIELLKMLDREAKSYRKTALASIERNGHMNDLSTMDIRVMKEDQERFQRFVIRNTSSFCKDYYVHKFRRR